MKKALDICGKKEYYIEKTFRRGSIPAAETENVMKTNRLPGAIIIISAVIINDSVNLLARV